jgi:hypothetical protein
MKKSEDLTMAVTNPVDKNPQITLKDLVSAYGVSCSTVHNILEMIWASP